MPEDKNIKHYKGQTLTASEYYYDCAPDTWDNMLYPDAIKDRRDRAWALFVQLYKESEDKPRNREVPIELANRLRKVTKAHSDNKQLCDEKSLVI